MEIQIENDHAKDESRQGGKSNSNTPIHIL